MKIIHYKILIGILAVGVVFSSYLAYTYLYILSNVPTPEEVKTQGFRLYICDLQQQLGYQECYVDGMTVDFDDIDRSNPYFDD